MIKITSKKPNSAKKVSHAHNRNNKKQNLNFQYVTINGVRFKTTAREARALKRMTSKKNKKVTD